MSRLDHFARMGGLACSLAALLPSGQASAQARERAPMTRSVEAPPPAPPPSAPPAASSRGVAETSPSPSIERGPQGQNPAVNRGMNRPGPAEREFVAVGATIIAPRGLPRCTAYPTPRYWGNRNRDLQAEIRWMCRRGSIQVHPIDETVGEFTDWAPYPAGWKAYGIAVPPGEKVHLRLRHPAEGWFSVRMMDKWGQLEPGMLQNLIPTGNPEVSYKNLTDKPRAVYILVDDPGWMSSRDNSFRMEITRSWTPSAQPQYLIPFVQGIWAVSTVEEDAPWPKEGEAPKAPKPKDGKG